MKDNTLYSMLLIQNGMYYLVYYIMYYHACTVLRMTT